MPSDLAGAPPKRLAWLRSQVLGVLCGQLTVLLLGVGSVVLVATQDGASAGVHLDDITAFFSPVSVVHTWFYALLGVLALYALNTVLCTFDAVVARLAHRIWEPSAWAPTLMHLAFGLALVAHLVGGLWSEERGSVVLREGWTELGGGRQARLVSLAQEALPDGRPKWVEAQVEVRGPDGRVETQAVGYNAPLTAGLGTELWLLEQAAVLPGALLFSVGPTSCAVTAGNSCWLGARRLEVLAVQPPRPPRSVSTATVRVTQAAGVRTLPLAEGGTATLSGGDVLRFDRLMTGNAVRLRGRTSPGTPWALGAAVAMALGLVLMGRRWR